MKVFKKLKEVYQKKGRHFLVTELWKRVMPIRFVRDMGVMDLHYEDKAYRYLKRKYLPLLKTFKPAYVSEEKGSARIWIFWQQGIENAPLIVKQCYESVLRNANGCEVVLLTENNMNDYIQIPSYIKDHLEKKHMQYAQYSDYIRLALLDRYGGVWIDATALLTSPMPTKLLEMDLFCFKTSYLSVSKTVASSWFIVSKKGNLIVQQVKYLMEEYWKRERTLCNYYLFHLLFALVVGADENNRRLWTKVPYIPNVDVHTLQFELFDDYDASRFDEICAKSFVHKLTYKFGTKDPSLNPNSNYSRLVKGELLNVAK